MATRGEILMTVDTGAPGRAEPLGERIVQCHRDGGVAALGRQPERDRERPRARASEGS